MLPPEQKTLKGPHIDSSTLIEGTYEPDEEALDPGRSGMWQDICIMGEVVEILNEKMTPYKSSWATA